VPPLGEGPPGLPPAFLDIDPPDHDRLRALATRPFGPPHTPERVEGMRSWLAEVTNRLIDKVADANQVDIVDDFAYPLPVTVICRLLGVPPKDEARFHQWADALVATLDPTTGSFEQRNRRRIEVNAGLGQYLGGLADADARQPGDDLISAMLIDTGPDAPMSREDLVITSILLLLAGHETTVNLTANGMLTLLRHPDELERLRHDDDLIVPLVEELLRFEPPVHLRDNRTALADIEVAGTTIPAGAPIVLALAAGNRDPHRFPDADRFDPDRTDNQHLGFGSSIHYCFGAPLARVEAQVALSALVHRLENPRLVMDPPPYRRNPALRGPRHLLVEIEGSHASCVLG
jgi:cytochrome P450